MPKTKIVATLGPKSMNPQMIQGLHAVGVSVFRLNCSHLSSEQLAESIRIVRRAVPIAAILVDVQGPKLRYGGPEVTLAKGSHHQVTMTELGLESTEGNVARGLSVGHRVLLDDGRVQTVVDAIDGDTITVKVTVGGKLLRQKGVNLPDTVVTGSVLSEKDRADIAVARDLGVDMVAISFVQQPADVQEVRELVGEGPMIIAKIERPQALASIDAICEVADGVMAARGDLGVELPYEGLPAAQRAIALAALRAGVISICATEMLESMIASSRPTRAEVSDVTGAVRDGFDAVMLSAETAVGADPVGTVRAMSRICAWAEPEVSMPNWFADSHPERAAVTAAAAALAKRTGADLILSITNTGYSAKLLAACRPSCDIVAVIPNVEAARRLAGCRGVITVVQDRDEDVTRAIADGIRAARSEGIVTSGQRIVICASRLNPNSDADTILLHFEP